MPQSHNLSRHFDEQLAAALASLGFSPQEEMLYVRPRVELVDVFAAGARPIGRGRLGASLGSVGLLLPRVESARMQLGLTKRNVTVSVGVHLLTPNRTFREWMVENPQDIDALVAETVRHLEAFGLPFLAAYETVSDIKTALTDSNPASWFTCSADSRGVSLVLIEFAYGDRPTAVQMCKRLLSELADRPPKYSRELRKLAGALEAFASP